MLDGGVSAATALPSPPALAEQGKLHAVEGDHRTALLYYRAALKLTEGEDNRSRLLSRYYAELALESLERTGEIASILAYCQKALDHYDANPPAGPLAKKDRASVLERQGVARFKTGDSDGARESLAAALEIGREEGFSLPVAATLHRWMQGGLHIDPSRLEALLQQHGYYSVNRQTIDPARARPLPKEILSALGAAGEASATAVH